MNREQKISWHNFFETRLVLLYIIPWVVVVHASNLSTTLVVSTSTCSYVARPVFFMGVTREYRVADLSSQISRILTSCHVHYQCSRTGSSRQGVLLQLALMLVIQGSLLQAFCDAVRNWHESADVEIKTWGGGVTQPHHGCRGHTPIFWLGDVSWNISQYYYVLSDIADRYLSPSYVAAFG